ncbi:preprotein translocase subunit SecG [Candidatus Vampirococcus lugosii]|uniref:Protein-export membrane protein SecG n=1 Tax=Candidatus Vampirococcus lugosii TaxID=2789015 RepID=A0ABS5QLH6_9BACT|nr:preprotein translocase subunit SecG [Candidatus Vampirococcus lugosii]MBS8121917.1 preprotein translocase subunit SecG [Candidatus Vampirococcus lugosii]
MRGLMIAFMLISGVVCIFSILLMSPKGGLGSGISGAGGEDFGSKKSIEGGLKKSVIISSIIFFSIALFLPYI